MNKVKYQSIIFLQGDSASECLDIKDEKGNDAAIQYLLQWDYGDNDDLTDDLGNGTSDSILEQDDYVMVYNLRLGYIGLSRKVIYE
jgi:hypothetical protein